MKNLLFLLAIVFLLPSCGTTGPSSGGGTTSNGNGDNGNTTYSNENPCDRTPKDPTKIEWMNNIIKKGEIEQVSRFDHQENIVYFFQVLKCCDFQSFLYDCKGNKICTSGGFTGGDCNKMFDQLHGEQIFWKLAGSADQ